MRHRHSLAPHFAALVAALVVSLITLSAHSAVKQLGQWPDEDPKVSLSLTGSSRSDALQQLAKQAGWSIVFRGPGTDPVDVHIADQPASKVLGLLLSDGHYIAERDGSLIAIAPAAPGDAPPTVAAAPEPEPDDAAREAKEEADKETQKAKEEADKEAKRAKEAADKRAKRGKGDDRTVTGSNAVIAKDEVVHDLVVIGGNADVHGTVTGDLAVYGGNVTLHADSVVEGDAALMGGNLIIKNDARLDGDVSVLGGNVEREEGAKLGGTIAAEDDDGDNSDKGRDVMTFASDIGGAMTRTALLFVFGTVLWALATRRMETLQLEVAGRPMRSFAMGVAGFLAILVLFIALCITVVGIPFAIVGLLAVIFGAYSGIVAVLATVGGTLMRHRTDNVYVHLAVGCGLFLLLGLLPYIGGAITFAVVAIGLGAVIGTRAAGFIKKRTNPAHGAPAI